MKRRDDSGVSLIEVVFALFILAVAISALLAGLGTASFTSSKERTLINTDVVLRSYAEATKQAVRAKCDLANNNLGAAITVTAPSGIPAGYTVTVNNSNASGTITGGLTCPSSSTAGQYAVVNVTTPVAKKLVIAVRTP